MTIDQARLAVAALSARVRGPHPLLLEITKQSQDQPPGTVLSQTPAPGSPVQPGMSIEVVVAAR